MTVLSPDASRLQEMGWEIKRIPEVAFFQEGPGLRNWQFRDSGMKIINGRNILPDGSIMLSNTDRHMDLEEFEQRYKHFAIDARDIVVASSGTYGKVGRIKEEHLPLMMNTSVIRFHPHSEDELNANFLMYFLKSHLFQDQVELFVTGTAQKNFGPSHVKEMWIPVPPISTQRKIADILSAYDDLIENNIRRIAILEEMAQRLYQEWFVHFRYPGHENVPLVDSELGPIPEGWEVKRVGDAFEILGGGTPSTKEPSFWDGGNIVWYSPTDLTSNGGLFINDSAKHITEEGLRRSSAKLFPPYSVMMTSRATIGVTAVNTTTACTNQGFITCVPNEQFSVYEIYYWLQERRGEIQSLASGATFKEINRGTFRELLIRCPDPAVRARFIKTVYPIWKVVETLSRTIDVLKNCRNLLLPILLSGKLEPMEKIEHITDVVGNVSIDPRFLVAEMKHELARHVAMMRSSLRSLEDGSYRERQSNRANPNLILFSIDDEFDPSLEAQRIMRSTLQSIFRSFGEFVDKVLAMGEFVSEAVQLDRTLNSNEELDTWIRYRILSRAAEIGSDKSRSIPRKIREIGQQPQWLLDITDGYFALRRTIEHHHSISQTDFAICTYRIRATTPSGTRDVELGDHFEAGQHIETFWEKREQRVSKGRRIALGEEGVELLAMSLGFVIGPALLVTMAFPDATADQLEFPELIVDFLAQEGSDEENQPLRR